MCTAISYNADVHYFGRTLDWFCSYGEKIVVTPRNYIFKLRQEGCISRHYAIIGTAVISDSVPLYFDAVNERGLAGAGLNFPDNAAYFKEDKCKKNIASFELISWILSQCENISQAKKLLKNTVITDTDFKADMPATSMHWIFADKSSAITVEQCNDGMKIYDNSIGVLTNNPPFDFHIENLKNYMSLSAAPPQNNFSSKLNLSPYSYGMGALGLPGDFSSASRFVRAAFIKENSPKLEMHENVFQFFHIIDSISQPKGCTVSGDKCEYTIYSSCCDTDKGIYYYKTYFNSTISAVDMNKCKLDGTELVAYDFITRGKIAYQN